MMRAISQNCRKWPQMAANGRKGRLCFFSRFTPLALFSTCTSVCNNFTFLLPKLVNNLGKPRLCQIASESCLICSASLSFIHFASLKLRTIGKGQQQPGHSIAFSLPNNSCRLGPFRGNTAQALPPRHALGRPPSRNSGVSVPGSITDHRGSLLAVPRQNRLQVRPAS